MTYRSLSNRPSLPARSRGFTLLVAVIFTSVVLSVALALSDVAYRQVVLASTARQSQYAFYAADAGLECSLYWDQKMDEFDYTTEPLSGSFSCQGQTVSFSAPAASAGSRTTTFSIPCAGGGSQSAAVIYKQSTGATAMDVSGYNSCTSSDPNRVERGLKASY